MVEGNESKDNLQHIIDQLESSMMMHLMYKIYS